MKRTELKRSTPLRARGLKPRRVKATCARLRCTRTPVRGLGVCKTHAKAEADRLCSLIVRSVGQCRVCGSTQALQWAHLVTRARLISRWSDDGSVCLCAKCHTYYTHNQTAWDLWCADTFGLDWWMTFKRRSLERYAPDYAVLIPALRSRLAALQENTR